MSGARGGASKGLHRGEQRLGSSRERRHGARPRPSTLSAARSRLDQRRFSRPNTHFSAFFKIYKKIIFSRVNFANFCNSLEQKGPPLTGSFLGQSRYFGLVTFEKQNLRFYNLNTFTAAEILHSILLIEELPRPLRVFLCAPSFARPPVRALLCAPSFARPPLRALLCAPIANLQSEIRC